MLITTRSKHVKQHVKYYVKRWQFSHRIHAVFTLTCISSKISYACENCPVKGMWKSMWNMLSLSHSVFTCFSNEFFKQTMWKTHVKSYIFTHCSYGCHICVSMCMWKERELRVKICSLFHIVNSICFVRHFHRHDMWANLILHTFHVHFISKFKV